MPPREAKGFTEALMSRCDALQDMGEGLSRRHGMASTVYRLNQVTTNVWVFINIFIYSGALNLGPSLGPQNSTAP